MLWSLDLGEGHAGAVVWEGRVFIMDYDEEKQADALRCFSVTDGKEIWRRWYNAPTKRNHGVSRTVPAVTEKFTVAMGPRCHVMCVDTKTGDFRWGIDLVREYGSTVPMWYTGQCPIIDGGIAVLAPAGKTLLMGVDCRLCETSCPFDYIDKPNTGLEREDRQAGVRRLGYLFVMLPVLIVLGGWVGHRMAIPMSQYNNTVALAEQVLEEKVNPSVEQTRETETYRAMGVSEDELMANALRVRSLMNMGGWLLGGFIGLVFGLKLIGFSISRKQRDYEVNKATCFSCGRCCSYCPSDDQHNPNFIPNSKPYQETLTLAHPTRTAPPQKEMAPEKKT